jgi:hypothetical protein
MLVALGILLCLGIGCYASEACHRVHVTVLRRTSSIHTSVSNRDEYLVRVTTKRGNAFVAKIIDEYPGYVDAAPFFSMSDTPPFSATLKRATYCDGGVGEGGGDEPVRCFAIVHGSWHFPVTPGEQWWK